MSLKKTLMVIGFSGLMACSDAPNGGVGSDADAAPEFGVAVFHLNDRVETAPLSAWGNGKLRRRVEDYYPAVCIDKDRDQDGRPGLFDPDDDGSVESDMDSDSDADNDSDGGEDSGDIRCRACNRGPGTNGDFRLKLDGDEAEIARGRAFTVTATEIIVPSPEGDITVQLGSDVEYEDGIPTPGAEIRVRGKAGATPLTVIAERVKVLCPGPGTVSEAELPPADETDPAAGGADGSGDPAAGGDDAGGIQ